jgi:hypothetical protein
VDISFILEVLEHVIVAEGEVYLCQFELAKYVIRPIIGTSHEGEKVATRATK